MNRLAVHGLVFGLGAMLWAGVALRRARVPNTVAVSSSIVVIDPQDVERAVKTWEAAQREDPQGATGIALLARAYLERFEQKHDPLDIVRAEASARRSLAARSSNNPIAPLALARALMSQHRFRDALTLVPRIVEPVQSAYIRAECHLELGDYDDAAHVLAQQPLADPYGQALLARLREIDGDTDGALQTYGRARTLAEKSFETPPSARAWFTSRVAACLAAQGKSAEAQQEFEAALALFPGDARSLLAIGRLMLDTGAVDDAQTWAEKAAAVAPSQEATLLLADLAAVRDDRARADGMWQALLSDRSLAHAHNRTLAMAMADRGVRLDDALALARADRKLRGDIYTDDALAWVQFQRGALADAAAGMQRALRRGTRDALLHYHAGRIAEARGAVAVAKRHYQDSLAFNPHFHHRYATDARRRLERL